MTLEDAIVRKESNLGRSIGCTSAYILAISRVIGSGIFAMPGAIIQDVGTPGFVLIIWILGVFLQIAILLLVLDATIPRSIATGVTIHCRAVTALAIVKLF